MKFTGKDALKVLDALTRPPLYLILHRDLVQGVAVWWRPGRAGYTNDVVAAGRYTKEEAESLARIRGDDFPVDEREIGRSLQPRMTINVEDGNNFEALKAFTNRAPLRPNDIQHNSATETP